jgi:hypothetical protein
MGAKVSDNDTRCSSYDTRWSESQWFYCIDGNKWSFEEEEIKYEGGSWQKTGVTRLKAMVESASTFCSESNVQYEWRQTTRWQCETPTEKFRATYSGGQTYYKLCNNSDILASGDTKPSGYEYSAMTSAVIGNCVTSIGESAFQYCYSLTSIDILDSVTSIGEWAFAYCSGLTSIDIPSGVTNISNSAFQGCSSLTSIDIPSGVTNIGGSAFRNCSGLSSIIVNATTPPTLGTYAFYNTTCPIYVPAASVDTYKSAENWSTYASRIQAIP